MFCSQCGAKVQGKFCSQCGYRLESQDGILELQEKDLLSNAMAWEQDWRYENIMRVEDVRSAIAHQAANATKGVSGEAFLALYDKIVSSPIPLERLAAIIQPLYESWGIRTGKQRSEELESPIGRTIAQTFCSLARRCQTFLSAQQHPTGCVLHAELPSSMCALKGKLMVSLVGVGTRTRVSAATDIPGQMYDWGKSNRCLDQFFVDLRSNLGLPPSHRDQVAA